MKWEELKTPEAVLAAASSGLKIEFRDEPDYGEWSSAFFTRDEDKQYIAYCMHKGTRYRALIETPALPPGYTPWGGGDGCPKEAHGNRTRVIYRAGERMGVPPCGEEYSWRHFGEPMDIIAYRVESEQAQTSQQGEAVATVGVTWAGAECNTVTWTPGRALIPAGTKLYTPPLPIPAEPPGRDAEGLSAGALEAWGYESIADRPPPRNATVVYWHRQEDGPGFPAIADEWRDEHHAAHAVAWHPQASGLARRLRPTVDEAMAPEPADIAVESFPSAPTGGMRVGMPAGVKITHKPTGCTVTVSHYRSQHRNRAAAIRALTAAMTEADHGK
jgi:hypothetical protein